MAKNERTPEQRARLIELRSRLCSLKRDEAREYAYMTDYQRMARENMFSTVRRLEATDSETGSRAIAAMDLREEELRLRWVDAETDSMRKRINRARMRVRGAIALLNGHNTEALKILREIEECE